MISDINNPGASAVSQSEIIVMFYQMGHGRGMSIYNHAPQVCNTLYMDGHVEFVHYQSKPPAIEPAVNTLMVLFYRYGK